MNTERDYMAIDDFELKIAEHSEDYSMFRNGDKYYRKWKACSRRLREIAIYQRSFSLKNVTWEGLNHSVGSMDNAYRFLLMSSMIMDHIEFEYVTAQSTWVSTGRMNHENHHHDWGMELTKLTQRIHKDYGEDLYYSFLGRALHEGAGIRDSIRDNTLTHNTLAHNLTGIVYEFDKTHRRPIKLDMASLIIRTIENVMDA